MDEENKGDYIMNSYYYMKIIEYKRKIRNTLILFERMSDEEITVSIEELAPLFLIDQDNVDKEVYSEKEMELIKPICEAFLSNTNATKNLTKKEAQLFINLALNKRLPLEYNTTLALKLAERYNENCDNELLSIKMEPFKELCNNIK